MEITDLLGLILEMSMHNFVEILQFRQTVPGVTRRSLMQREFYIQN